MIRYRGLLEMIFPGDAINQYHQNTHTEEEEPGFYQLLIDVMDENE